MRTLRKRDDSLVQKRDCAKNLLHFAAECSFSIQLLRKRPFRVRVVKSKVVYQRKIHGQGPTPDQNWPFRSRLVKALIFVNGKSEYFCSLFGSPGAKSEQKNPVLSFAKKKHFHHARTQWLFWVGRVSITMYFAMRKKHDVFVSSINLRTFVHSMAFFRREWVHNHVYCDAKSPSPSPLSHGMASFGHLG